MVAALGAYNHLRLVPALTQGKATAALAPALDDAPPGGARPRRRGRRHRRARGGDAGADRGRGRRGGAHRRARRRRLRAAHGRPGPAGFNQIHLYLFDPDGRPAEIAESVTLVLSLPSAELGPISREASAAGPAHLQLDGNDLAVAGTWTIEVRARIDRFTEATGTAEVPIAA